MTVASEVVVARLLLLVLALVSHGVDGGDLYHNHFAAHIPGGSADPSLVEAVADGHGLHSLGQIGSLEDHFLFEHRRYKKHNAC